MRDPLEQELRRLIIQFDADIWRVVLRSLQAVLDGVPKLVADLIAADPLARAGTDAAVRTANNTTPAADAGHGAARRT
jgi:hypothetical protein